MAHDEFETLNTRDRGVSSQSVQQTRNVKPGTTQTQTHVPQIHQSLPSVTSRQRSSGYPSTAQTNLDTVNRKHLWLLPGLLGASVALLTTVGLQRWLPDGGNAPVSREPTTIGDTELWLNQAEMLSETQGATGLAEAIEIAKQIPEGAPEYAKAQDLIQTWEQQLVDVAVAQPESLTPTPTIESVPESVAPAVESEVAPTPTTPSTQTAVVTPNRTQSQPIDRTATQSTPASTPQTATRSTTRTTPSTESVTTPSSQPVAQPVPEVVPEPVAAVPPPAPVAPAAMPDFANDPYLNVDIPDAGMPEQMVSQGPPPQQWEDNVGIVNPNITPPTFPSGAHNC